MSEVIGELLHPGTLICVNALVSWLTGTAFLLAAAMRPKLAPRNSLLLWFLAYYALSFGFSVLMLPTFDLGLPLVILTGNLLLDLGTALNFIAVLVYLKCSWRYLLYLVPAGALALIETVYVVSQFENLRLMVILGCTLRGILTVAAGSALWACTDEIRRPIARVIAGFHYLWALVLVSRMLWWLVNPAAATSDDPTTAFGLTARLLLTCTIMPCFLWMLTRQLDAEVLHHASRDGLTGAFNRRVLWERGEQRISEARRSGCAVAVIMIDIDHFKKINDGWGHSVGDQVLVAAANALAGAVRAEDIVARIGGEEFMVLLDKASAAAEAAERIRAAVSLVSVTLEDGQRLGATVSVGHAQASGKDAQWHTLVADADAALYRAKNGGRNMVVDAASFAAKPVMAETPHWPEQAHQAVCG